uniref:glycosyltransferase family 2 protein n=1 Tax=Acetatifactor sp. TaxID=1872090 RepID=UPI0040565773
MKSVQVLMSTYNGEKFLREQIESILKQIDVDVHILIRDDGSTDTTVNLIQEYISKYPNKIRCVEGKNIGVKFSFLELVHLSEKFDYYAFSDQDDIWEKSKLINAVNMLDESSRNCTLLYVSNVKILSDKIEDVKNENKIPKFGFGKFLVKNYFPGCTMVFSRKLKDIINLVNYKELNTYPLHDHWICLLCTGCGGKIIYDKNAYILYRQHQNNVVGSYRSLWTKLQQNGIVSKEQRRYHIVVDIKKNYYEYLDVKAKRIIDLIINYRSSFTLRLKLAFSREIHVDCFAERVLLFLTIMMGRF